MATRQVTGKVRRVIASSWLILACAGVSAEEQFARVDQGDVLFLAHFNRSLAPDLSRGKGTPNIYLAEITGGGEGYPFADSLPSAEALNLRSRSSWIAWPAAGHIDLNQGTVQFWIKPFWRQEGKNSPFNLLFRLRFSEDREAGPWKNPANSFFIAKLENREEIRLSQGEGGLKGNIASWGAQTWHQIAATWKSELFTLYLDGQKAGAGKYRKPADEPAEIVMGSPFWGHDAESLIDELRILKRPLDDKEIRQDYLAQAAHREFPDAARTNAATVEMFRPATPEARKVASSFTELEISAPYTASAIKIDGKLDEPAWAAAREVTGFRLRANASAAPVAAQSFVKVLYDDKFLYFGARFLEPRMDKLEAKFNQRDLDIYGDDCLEIVFDTRGRPDTFHHFCANLIGGIYDSKNGDKNWSSYHSLCQGARGNGEWTLELAIPFADLEIPRPIMGEVWGLRLCRERKPVSENTSIPFTDAAFFARQDLARLVFAGAAGAAGAFTADTKAAGITWGLNRIVVQLSNPGNASVPARVAGTLLGKNNAPLGMFEVRAEMPPKGAAEAILNVPLTTDAAERLSLVAYDAQGTPVWGKALAPLFAPSVPSLAEIEAELPAMKGDAFYISANRHPITQGALKSVARLEEDVAAFRAKVEASVKTGATVSPADWESLRTVLAGFDAWRRQNDILVWEVDPWTDGSPRDLPPAAGTAPELRFALAGNEREGRALALHGLMVGGRFDVRLAVSHLTRAGDPKSYISPNCVHVYRALYMRDGFGRLITDALLECAGNIVTLSPGRTEKVWVVLDSRGLEPGAYEGTITLKPLDTAVGRRNEWKTILLKATVWNFALPETRDWPLDTFLFYGGLTPCNEIEMMRLLHAYHVNWVMSNRFRYDVGITEDGKLGVGKPKDIEFNQFFRPELIASQDDFLREAKRLGMKVMFAWNCTRNPDWFRQMIPHLKELGFAYKDFAFQGMSDEFLAVHVEKHMPFHRAIYALDTNIQFMATFTSVPPPEGATFEQIEEPARYVKIWIHHLPRLWPPEAERTRENLAWFRARQRTLWTYTCAQQMQNWPCVDYYRLSPWRAYLTGIDGISYWTFMSSSGDDGFDHGDGYDEGMAFRGLNNAPVPTKRLEALREGLEDVAYMHILRARLSAAKAKEPNRDYSAQEKLLTEIPLAIEKSKDARQIEEWREKTALAILALPVADQVEKK